MTVRGAADDAGMNDILGPGSGIAVVWRGQNSGSARGLVRNVSETAIAVEFDTPMPWEPEQELLLIAGAGSTRCIARAHFVTMRERTAIFSLHHTFRPFDLRGQPRFPVLARAEVRPVLGQTRHPGMVLDISSGGLAVEVGQRPSALAVEVLMAVFGYSATLPCNVVGSSDGEGRTVLHLSFADLSLTQQAFVRSVISQLEYEMERYAA